LHDDVPRYREGYDQVDRPDYEKGFDLNKWVWRYKKMHWINPKLNLNIVCPSSWLAKCASESLLFRNRQVRHIINPIDTEIFKSCDKKEALEALGLSELVGKKVISFGADAATSAKRKGYDYLVQAIDALESCPDRDSYAFLIFGGPRKQKEYIGSIPTYSLGRIDDVRKLVKLYGASDVFVLPTLRDNLPNVIKEAMVCGVPCVGFDVGGMPDMITHLQDGYLAKPFDAADLARGIQWTLKNITEAGREDIRKIAAARHSEKNAVRQYLEYYKTVVGENDVLNAHINRLSSP
jgi:glycosyltransferase involved in cell wall biosynthesis